MDFDESWPVPVSRGETRRCTCGHETKVGDIHTCSPAVPVSRGTGEGRLDRTLVRLYAEFTDAECAVNGAAGVVIRDLARDILAGEAANALLTAEVQRLRGVVGLEALTAEIVAWQRETFPHGTAESVVAHLIKEVVELAKAPRDPSEIADCYFLVVGAADRAGVNLVDAVADKLAVNRSRVWGKPDAQGVVEHIRPALTPPAADTEDKGNG